MRICRPFCTLTAMLSLSTAAALAQTATPPPAADPAHLTVDAVNRNPTGPPPRGAVWSPDGRLLTWMVTANQSPVQDGQPIGRNGDIVQIEAATGKVGVLATAQQLDALGAAAIDEKDRDHRDRYKMSAFLWADDSKHLLLDKGGMLWLYDIAAGTGTLIVDTRAGSGDDPKFSPDAKFVSYLRDHNLYVHPVASDGKPGKEIALTGTKPSTLLNGELDWVYLEELDARSNYAWSPDSANLVYLQMDEARVPVYPIEDFLPTHATLDQQRFPQPGDANPGVRVGVVPARGGKTSWISLPVSQNNDYIPRLGWVDANTVWVQLLTRDQKSLGLYFADIKSGVSRLVHRETDAKYLEDNYDVMLLPHGQFLNTSWRDGHTHLYLYQYDEKHPADQEATLVRQLTQGDYEVELTGAPKVLGEVPAVYFLSTEGSPVENNLWSIRLDGMGKRQITTGHGVHELTLAPDGQHFADIYGNMTTGDVYNLCSVATAACSPMWQSKPFGPVSGVSATIVSALAADGVTPLYGTLYAPAGTGAASIPLIVNPYGGPVPNAGTRNASPNTMSFFSMLLAQHGYAVLTVDNRGSGGRGRDFQQADYRNFGAVQLADQLAFLDQTLAKNPQFDPQRIGWWGWSWGGTFTLYAMTHSDRIKAGVAVAPVTDFRNYDSIYTERYLGLPAEEKAAYDAAAVKNAAANLKGRILIAHGTGDDNVHVANTLQFIQPLIQAGIPYDLQLFPRLTHSIAGLAARNELFNRILYQFDTYLKPKP